MSEHHRPIWDKGGAIDADMLRFTIGDDWLQDRRLIEVDIQGSLAHAALTVGLHLCERGVGKGNCSPHPQICFAAPCCQCYNSFGDYF